MKTPFAKKLLIVTFTLLMVGCSSPQKKVEQMEKKNEALRESSGYNECMRLVEIDNKKIKDCIQGKIVAAGYSDRMDCIANFEEAICKDKARYNTEVFARNDCPNEVKFETELAEGDCIQMLMEAQ